MEIHKDYEYIWHKYAEKDKSAAFRQRDQFISNIWLDQFYLTILNPIKKGGLMYGPYSMLNMYNFD